MANSIDTLSTALGDRYHLVRELGRGGMATVYLAQDLRHSRHVALKVLRADLAASIGHDRFLREIEIAAVLTHPHIVPLLDSGAADGTLYYTMPHVDGGSLRALLDRERELPIAESLRIVGALVDALRHAHASGIVHRDLKPENILFASGWPQIADFGIAKAIVSASLPRLTETGLAVGTPAYMAPEQAAADPHVDQRADIYAIGAIWYEMLTGAPMFTGLSPQQQVAAHMVRTPEPPSQRRSAVSRAVSDAVLRCLEKRPADRWQTADELAQVIAALGASGSGPAAGSVDPEPALQRFTITDALSQRLSRDAFDPRMVGDELHYLDNGRVSDTLVCYLARWCIDPDDGNDLLRQTPYRAIAPALLGFEGGRRYRTHLPIADHLILLDGLLHELVASSGARHVILVGFSTGGDLALRLAAADPGTLQTHVDGALVLGPNLSRETTFLSAELARAGVGPDESLLAFLQGVGETGTSLDEWLDVNEYLVRLMRRFRGDLPVLQRFAEEVSDPFVAAPLTQFVDWYRAATDGGRLLRCVFEDSAVYRGLVRQLLVGQQDDALLGQHFQSGSLIIEPGTGHFDLEAPALISRHLDVFVGSLRDRTA